MADESFWGLLELMGHRRLAGKITRDDGGLIRIDIPDGCTQWYGTGAVYAITPMSEETARAAASQLGEPFSVYDARRLLEGHYAEREAELRRREQALRGIEYERPEEPPPHPDDDDDLPI